MCKKIKVVSVVLAVCLAFSGCATKQKSNQITVLAAASLEPALTKIIEAFNKQSNTKIVASYGASGQLSTQIITSGEGDIFISAGQKQMKDISENKMCSEFKPLLKNKLVAVSHEKIDDLQKIKEFKTIAVGEQITVPAGTYAQEALENAKLYDEIKPNLVFANNVREVLTMVKTKNAEVGFVYKTDAISEKDLQMLEISAELYKEIVYPYCLLKNGEKNKNAQEFFSFLQSETATEIFIEFGFETA